jgi:hypothetical protein
VLTDQIVTVRDTYATYTAVVLEDFGNGLARVAVIEPGDSWYPAGFALTVTTLTLESLENTADFEGQGSDA